MNKFNCKIVDSMLGRQDERERLETYERMAVCYAYLYWGSILVGLGSWIMGWKDGEAALGLWFLLGLLLHSWAKVSWSECNDLSSTVISPSEKNHTGNGQRHFVEGFEKFFNFFRRLLCHDFCNDETEKSRSPQPVNFIFCGIDIFVYGGRLLLQRGHEGEKGLARAAA